MSFWLNIKSTLPPDSISEKEIDIISYFDTVTQSADNAEPVRFWIGRDDACQLKIADEKISRRHCYIERTDSGLLKLVDNNSSNGTYVNTVRIAEIILSDNDVIRLSKYEIILTTKTEAGASLQSPPLVEAQSHSVHDDGASAVNPTPEVHPVIEKPVITRTAHFPVHKDLGNDTAVLTTHTPKKTSNSLGWVAAVLAIAVCAGLMVFLFYGSEEGNKISNKPAASSAGHLPPTDNQPQTPAEEAKTKPGEPATDINAAKPETNPAPEESAAQSNPQAEPTELEKSQPQSTPPTKIEPEKTAAAKHGQASLTQSVREKQLWLETKPNIKQELMQFDYAKSLAALDEALKSCQSADIKKEIYSYKEDIKGEQVLFNTMLSQLIGGNSRKKIVIDTREIYITKADENGFEGTMAGISGSVYTRRWPDVPTQALLNLFPKDLTRQDRYYLAVFCYHHGLESQGEQILINCLSLYPDEKEQIAQFLAGYREIPVPPGGFAVYEGQLVTAEEKFYWEKGYVKYQDKWMLYDDMMTARGYVKFQSKWMTPAEKEKIEAQLSALQALQKQLAPKGMIDQPGADKEKLTWDKARTKETAHYIIKANLSQDAVDDLCYLMECYYFEAKKIFKLTADPANKLTVYVFRESKDYYSNGGQPGSGGVFMEGGSHRQIMTFYQPPHTTLVLLHEGTHQFIHTVCNTKVPIWIDEGLATYYESSKFEGTALKTNLLNRERLQMIKDMIAKQDVPRLEDIINIRQANFAIYEYAQCWSLVYFFMNYNHGQYADDLEAYFNAIKAKGFENRPKHRQLFEDAFKVKFETLEKQWEDYIKKLS